MKTRNGFVSNSSSSSFLIMGLEVKNEQIKKLNIDQLKELLGSDSYNHVVGHYTQKICCGKELKTDFCPLCGKSKNDVVASLDMSSVLNSLFSEYPPEDFGFFGTENGSYYCTNISGSINNILKERELFIKAASILYADFPKNGDNDSILEWLNRNLVIDGGEYYS